MKPFSTVHHFLRLAVSFCLFCFTSFSYLQATDFITTWQTDNTGLSADDQITIPGIGAYTVNWVEVGVPGNTGTTSGSGDVTVTFPSAGTYQVSIPSGMTQMFFNDGGDKLKLLTVEQWGTLAWTNMTGAFHGCTNLTSSAIDKPDLALVKNMSEMFRECSNFNAVIGAWDVLGVTNMSGLFFLATNFDQNIGAWKVDSVTDMSYMFRSATLFNQPIGAWKVDSVSSTSYMFRGASNFNQDISSWNVAKVTTMREMFFAASDFNQNIGGWTVSKVVNMFYMFGAATDFNQDIGTWDVSEVTNMSSMFRAAQAFNQDIGNWEVDSVTNMNGMFYVASNFNQDISSWDVDSVNNMSDMFFSAGNFNQDISGWNVASVSNMSSMFNGAADFNQDISGWDVSDVSNMSNMFSGATAFNRDIGGWDISGSPTMTGMLDNSGLSVTNYDNTLIGWEAQAVASLTLGADALDFCNGETARDELLGTHSWTITGDLKDCSTLPVEWLHFDAVAQGKSVQINWATANESNNDYFLIEKRLGNEDFAPIGQVDARGFSDTRLDYSFEDRSPMSAVVYYRIQQVDFDGRAERSNIVEVHFDALGLARYAAYPNPAHQSFTLKAISEIEQAHTYEMFDLSGKTVLTGSLAAGIGQTQIKVTSLPAGTYLLQVKNAKGQLVNLKLTIE